MAKLMLLLSIYLALVLLCSAYTLPFKHFINCGSDEDVKDAGRTFLGDSNSGSCSILAKHSSSVKNTINPSSDTSNLYQTAKIFRHPSVYKFKINDFGTHVVRLHFFAFPFSHDLTTPLFNVSASGVLLLSNFTVKNNVNSAVIKEFILGINTSKFYIQFAPQDSFFAFANALEVFLVDLSPDKFIPDEALYITATKKDNNFTGILSRVLQTFHRINVGGPTLTPTNGTLWRNWYPDNGYFDILEGVTDKSYSGTLEYAKDSDKLIAPDFVYKTGRVINISKISTLNITLSFNVSRNTKHLLRLHFCDIVSSSVGITVFNVYINSHLGQMIAPFDRTNKLAVPFYNDFMVDSDNSGFLSISIAPCSDSDQTAFLNGVEIMELMEDSSPAIELKVMRKKMVFAVVGSVVGAAAILAAVLLYGFKWKQTRPIEASYWLPFPYGKGSSRSRATEGTSVGSTLGKLNLGLKISFSEIQYATKNFNVKMQVGKGGFGNVYKGTLRNGMKVAVKRSQPGSGQGFTEFQTEIIVLSKIRHLHLVSLIGYCDEYSEMILVYEFMENGILNEHLYGSDGPALSWKQRLQICIGAARGLHYLHKGLAGGIIHRDVKTTNILLDENLEAKVADFGISRPIFLEESNVSTCVKGTFGYLDPEYLIYNKLTEKSDVYSFGVVLLEVLCARPPIDRSLPIGKVNLVEWGMGCKNTGLVEEIVDPLIKDEISPNSLKKIADTIEKCLQEDGADRPAMSDVLWDLKYALQPQKMSPPKEPHEDSTITGSSSFTFSNVHKFSSSSSNMCPAKDDMHILKDYDSFTSGSGIEVSLN